MKSRRLIGKPMRAVAVVRVIKGLLAFICHEAYFNCELILSHKK